MSLGFNIKRPKGAAKSYSVTPYQRRADGTKEYLEKIEDDALELLNRKLKAGEITSAQAELEFTHVILPRLKKKSDVQTRVLAEAQVSERNLENFKKFWNKTYAVRKKTRSIETAYSEFLRALRIIEPLSVTGSSQKQLQDKLNEIKDGSVHKKLGGRLNQLLQAEGRNFVLYTLSAKKPRVKYVTWDEFVQVLKNVVLYKDNTRRVNETQTKDIKALLTLLFGIGCRFGELFPLRYDDLKADNSIFIDRQLTRDREIDEIKNSNDHKALMLNKPEIREAWEHWHSLDDKEIYRGKTAWNVFTRACEQTFKVKDKHLTIHDLRHSYVVHLLGLGVPLDRVSKLIGDKLSTCEKYYSGFVASDAEIDFVTHIIREGEKRQKKTKKH